MTERQAEMLDYAMLWRFFETPLFMRMKRAKRLYREKRFFLSADAADFYGVPPGGAGIMVQGVIDCFFEDESGECVLIDFKTDRTDDEAKLKARYGGQLDIYRRAISEVFKRRCREVYIYSFYTGKLISFEA
jgi:ATP-dependent helicase/nuclease subunit A